MLEMPKAAQEAPLIAIVWRGLGCPAVHSTAAGLHAQGA